MNLPAIATTPEDELRIDHALAAMLGLETMLEATAPDHEIPAREMLGLVRAVHAAVRDVLLFEAPRAANDA